MWKVKKVNPFTKKRPSISSFLVVVYKKETKRERERKKSFLFFVVNPAFLFLVLVKHTKYREKLCNVPRTINKSIPLSLRLFPGSLSCLKKCSVKTKPYRQSTYGYTFSLLWSMVLLNRSSTSSTYSNTMTSVPLYISFCEVDQIREEKKMEHFQYSLNAIIKLAHGELYTQASCVFLFSIRRRSVSWERYQWTIKWMPHPPPLPPPPHTIFETTYSRDAPFLPKWGKERLLSLNDIK